jgi:hypothetical protein
MALTYAAVCSQEGSGHPGPLSHLDQVRIELR